MNNTKYTPGPWAIEYTGCSDDTDFDIETATIRAGHIVVAEIECHHESIANIEANAKLIAAAPDMAARLRDIVQAYEIGSSSALQVWIEDTRALLAKAGL